MSNFAAHTLINYVLLSIVSVVIYTNQQVTAVQYIFFLVGYIIGTFYLSPDLDIKSEVSNNTGFLFKPYRKLFKHRGISHNIFFGFITRIIYVICVIGIIFILAVLVIHFVFRFEIPDTEINEFIMFLPLLSYMALGIFISNLFHIILDKL